MKNKICVIAFLLTAVITLASCDSASPTGAGTTSSNQSSISEETKDDKLNIGETGNLTDWEICLNKYEIKDAIEGNTYGTLTTTFEPDEGNKYVYLELSVKNISNDSETFLPVVSTSTSGTSVKLIYNNDYTYSSTNLLAHDKELHSKFFNPLTSFEGILAFQIPDSVATASDSLILEIKEGRDSLQYVLR